MLIVEEQRAKIGMPAQPSDKAERLTMAEQGPGGN
jgi:hypothetical protein